MPAISISDPADPRVEPYRAIRDRDLAQLNGAGRQGLFVVEGEVVLAKFLPAAAAGRWRARSLLIDERRLEGLAGLLAKAPADTPVYAATQAVLDAVVGFPIHRGVLALGERPPPAAAEALLSALPARARVVVLCGVANHDNLGGVFRNAAAFGADLVLLDATCCDPLYRKAIRVSVGGVFHVPFARLPAGVDLPDLLEAHGLRPLALSGRGAVVLHDLVVAPRLAMLFGAEGPGLPPELLARCLSVRIDMAGGFDSLNLATTSGIVLHHLTT